MGSVIRSSAETKPKPYRPLTHKWPLLTGASATGFTDTTRPSLVPTAISHPVPQYGHVVRVHSDAGPRTVRDASSSAPVGHVSTHAPQLTQEL